MNPYAIIYNLPYAVMWEALTINWILSSIDPELEEVKQTTMLEF